MAYTFRNSTSIGNDNALSHTVTKPTGTVDGDLLVVVAESEAAASTWSVIGSGFTSIATVTSSASKLTVWWKIASSEPASWTWTLNAGAIWTSIVCLSYSGGVTPSVDIVGSGNSGTSQPAANQTAPSVTTTAANDLLLFCYCNDTSTVATSTSGAASTLRLAFGNVSIGEAIIASPGATGTTQAVGAGTQTFAAVHVAFKDGASAFTPRMMLLGVG